MTDWRACADVSAALQLAEMMPLTDLPPGRANFMPFRVRKIIIQPLLGKEGLVLIIRPEALGVVGHMQEAVQRSSAFHEGYLNGSDIGKVNLINKKSGLRKEKVK